MIRVVLIDDHPVVREGVVSLLSNFSSIDVVASAANGEDALLKVSHFNPDVVLLDVRLHNENGLDLIEPIRSAEPNAQVLMLTSFEEDDYVIEALRRGAIGYILKSASDESLVQSIEAAARGERVLSPQVTERVVQRLLAEGETIQATPLEPDEIEILRLLAAGAGNDDISDQLFISATTLKRKTRRILEKMNVQTRVQAVAEAVRKGLI